VQRINGRATQAEIRLPLQAFPFTKPSFKVGETFEWSGYETGGYIGHPGEAMQQGGAIFQTTGHYFRLEFVAAKEKKIDAIVFAPADFVDREALLEGQALNAGGSAYIAGASWRLLVDARTPWPAAFEGKRVEGVGLIRRGPPGDFRLEGQTRLVRLEDQIGREVALRGRLWSQNDQWHFDYRGTRVQLENPKAIAGLQPSLHGDTVLMTGVLEESLEPNPERKEVVRSFLLRKAALHATEPLRASERPDPIGK
jgi:hypothetical protein